MNRPVTCRRSPALDVAVVGGGVVGAASALALARSGFSVTLLEATQPPQWHGVDALDLRVVGLAPSSVALFDYLGVWSVMRAERVCPYRHMRVWDSQSGATITFDAATEGRELLGYIAENRLLQWTLWQALDEAGVQRRCPVRVRGFTLHGNRVLLRLTDDEKLAARLLVGADGAASPLRAMAGIATHGRDYGQQAVVAHASTEHFHQDTAWQRFLPTGPLAFLPLADGRSSVVWSLPRDNAQRMLSLDTATFCKALGLASDFCLGTIRSTTQRAAFPLKLQLAERYQTERFVLLGDAAHVVHPLAGQGVNMGLRDVRCLHDVLVTARDAGGDFAASHILRRYARRRRSANTFDAHFFDGLVRLYAWHSPVLVAARGFGVRLCDRLEPLKRCIIEHAAGSLLT